MRFVILFILSISAIGCSLSGRPPIQDGAPSRPINSASIPDAIPKVEPVTRAGNPPVYTVLGKQYRLMNSAKGYKARGIASWYGTKFHGRKTANGERYDMYAMTAAHKTIPIPAYLKVTNLKNHRSVIVRVNDRGPFHANRIIDLSYAAASKLDILRTGTGFVEIESIDPTAPPPVKKAALPAQKPAVTGELYLQIGAFSRRANALKLSQQIHAKKLAGVRIQSDIEEPVTVHRVQIGPLRSTQEADRLIKALAQLGITGSRLITEPSGQKKLN